MNGSPGKVVDDLGLVEEVNTGVAVMAIVGAYCGEVKGAGVVEIAVVDA